MAGIKVDTRSAILSLQRTNRFLENPRPALELIAEELYRVARVSFEKETSPEGAPWLPLSVVYAARKGKLFPGRGILRRRGQLIRSLRRGVVGNIAMAETGPLAHGSIHQLGGKAGRGRKVTIPARPYLGYPPDSQERNRQDIEDLIIEQFQGR